VVEFLNGVLDFTLCAGSVFVLCMAAWRVAFHNGELPGPRSAR